MQSLRGLVLLVLAIISHQQWWPCSDGNLNVINKSLPPRYDIILIENISSKVLFALKSTLEGSSIINLLWNSLDNFYEVSVVVVTATTLLLKWGAWVHNWASSKHLWGAKIVSWAGYSCYYGEKYHFHCLNGCPAWYRDEVFLYLTIFAHWPSADVNVGFHDACFYNKRNVKNGMAEDGGTK